MPTTSTDMFTTEAKLSHATSQQGKQHVSMPMNIPLAWVTETEWGVDLDAEPDISSRSQSAFPRSRYDYDDDTPHFDSTGCFDGRGNHSGKSNTINMKQMKMKNKSNDESKERQRSKTFLQHTQASKMRCAAGSTAAVFKSVSHC